MSEILQGLDGLIEAEVEKRVKERLASQAGLELQSHPEVEQPGWYGSIRRRFGWPRWRYVAYDRKLFLATLGTMLQNKAVDRFRGGLRLFCDILEPFATNFRECMENMPVDCKDEVQDEEDADIHGLASGISVKQWRLLASLFDSLARQREPVSETL